MWASNVIYFFFGLRENVMLKFELLGQRLKAFIPLVFIDFLCSTFVCSPSECIITSFRRKSFGQNQMRVKMSHPNQEIKIR